MRISDWSSDVCSSDLFDMPTRDRRCQCAKHARAETQQRAHGGAVADIARDRLEPARDTAIERVVVDTLPVRLMRLARDRGVARSLEHAVTPPPVTSTQARKSVGWGQSVA